MMLTNKPLPKWLRDARDEISADYYRDPDGFLDRFRKDVAGIRKRWASRK